MLCRIGAAGIQRRGGGAQRGCEALSNGGETLREDSASIQ